LWHFPNSELHGGVSNTCSLVTVLTYVTLKLLHAVFDEADGKTLSYIVLRGRWRNIIVVNVHAPSEEKSDEAEDSFYEELEQVFDHFPKYHMKMLLGDFNAKVGKENIFKPTTDQDSNDNGVRLANFAISKNMVVKSTMFSHRNIHKYT